MMIICTSDAMGGLAREADEETEAWFQAWVPVDGEKLGLMIYPKASWMAIDYVPKIQTGYLPIFAIAEYPEVPEEDDFD